MGMQDCIEYGITQQIEPCFSSTSNFNFLNFISTFFKPFNGVHFAKKKIYIDVIRKL